ncbi:MAG TPA: histidine triad nucleotide-binding protein [Anaerolineaceae bacterium]|nr:histidine triad nucleotide-binding protein [Anaerolineaceae bacterium]
MTCIFCSIIERKAPAIIVYEDDMVIAFRSINPIAPVHLLIVPKRHIESVNTLLPEDEGIMGHLFTTARALAAKEGIAQAGYRLVTNTGPDGGQSVYHIHMHLIGGRHLPFRFD